MSLFFAGFTFSQGCGLGRVPLLPLQEHLPSVPSATAMRKPVRLFFVLLLTAGFARGAIKTPENAPIEITSSGETSYENGLATARDNDLLIGRHQVGDALAGGEIGRAHV